MERIDGVKPLFYLYLFAILSTDLLLVHGITIQTDPQSLTTAEGQTVNLVCKSPSPLTYCRFEIPGEPRPLLLSEKVDRNPSYKYYGNGLGNGTCGITILRVKLANHGPFKCSLDNQGEEFEAQIDLTVAYPPQRPIIKLLTPPQHGPAYEIDENIEVQCESHEGRPPAKLSWFLNGEPILEGVQKEKVQDVIISHNGNSTTVYKVQQTLVHRIRAEDDGKFLMCRADHPAGHPQDVQIPLKVRYRPQPQQEIYVYGLNLAKTAMVTVTINSNPAPETVWSVDGVPIRQGEQKDRYEANRPIDLGNGTYNITLTIAGLTVEDTTKTYNMRASNSLGTTDYLIHITSSPQTNETGIDVGSIVGIIIGIVILLVIISVIVFARATGKWCFSGASINTDIGPDSEAQIAPHHDDYDEKEYDHDTEDRHTDTQHTEKNEKLQQQQQQQQQRNGNEQKTNTPV